MSENNKLIHVDELTRLAQMLSKSSLLPPDLRGKEADIAVTVMAGRELGLAPMASLRSINVIKGKPVLGADAMVGLVLSAGVADYFSFIESTATIATYETKRKGAPHPQRLSFTFEQAKAAGLTGNDNWRKYPDAMLRARAKAALARDVYSDVLAGCYTEDEAAAFSDYRPPARHVVEDAIDAEVVTSHPAQPAPKALPEPTPDADPSEQAALEIIAAIDEAPSADAVQSIAPRFSALPKGSRARAAAAKAYKDKLAQLEASKGAA